MCKYSEKSILTTVTVAMAWDSFVDKKKSFPSEKSQSDEPTNGSNCSLCIIMTEREKTVDWLCCAPNSK